MYNINNRGNCRGGRATESLLEGKRPSVLGHATNSESINCSNYNKRGIVTVPLGKKLYSLKRHQHHKLLLSQQKATKMCDKAHQNGKEEKPKSGWLIERGKKPSLLVCEKGFLYPPQRRSIRIYQWLTIWSWIIKIMTCKVHVVQKCQSNTIKFQATGNKGVKRCDSCNKGPGLGL